jgi:hypothetical protein
MRPFFCRRSLFFLPSAERLAANCIGELGGGKTGVSWPGSPNTLGNQSHTKFNLSRMPYTDRWVSANIRDQNKIAITQGNRCFHIFPSPRSPHSRCFLYTTSERWTGPIRFAAGDFGRTPVLESCLICFGYTTVHVIRSAGGDKGR